MLFPRLALAVLVSTLFGCATADLQIIVPGGSSLWWINNSDNNLIWTCNDSPYTQFNVLIANSNTNLLTAPLPIISTLDNFVCAKGITKDMFNLQAGTGYTIQLTDIFNNTHIYATSQPFEIKPLGSAYPDASATPTGTGTTSGTGTNTASSPSSTATGSTGSSIKSSVSGLVAFVALALGVFAA